MEIVASASDWLFTDAENLLAFLNSETGKRFLPKLAELTPVLLPSGDTNAVLIRSGEVRGVQIILQAIFSLAHPTADEAPKITDLHPPLEDDKAWNDGESVANPKDLFAVPATETPNVS